MSKRLMSSTMLRAVADLVDAGLIQDFAMVAIPTDPQFNLYADFGKPPVDADRLIKGMKEVEGWVGNKEANDRLAEHLASVDAS